MSIQGSITSNIRSSIQGVLNSKEQSSIQGSINSTRQIAGVVQASSVVIQERDYYEGSYAITPSLDSQMLFVKEKTMRDDLQIEAIPYAEVSNSANGITVTIGK